MFSLPWVYWLIFGVIGVILLGNFFDKKKMSKGSKYLLFIIVGFCLFIGVYKIYPEKRKVVFRITFIEVLDKQDGRYILGLQNKDELLSGHLVKFHLSTDDPKIIKDSPKGNFYEKKCAFSEHWLGLWTYGYDEQCKEYLYIVPK